MIRQLAALCATTGLIWNTHGALIDHYPSVLVRSDGTRFTLPEGTLLTHSFDRNTPWTAGGYENTSGWQAAVLYKCGS